MKQHSLTLAEIELIRAELIEIKVKNYHIGDVSALMKRLVVEVYGNEDWSTSGYWVRAEQIINRS